MINLLSKLAIPAWVPWAIRGIVALVLVGLIVALKLEHSALLSEKDHYRLAVAGAQIQAAQIEKRYSAQLSTAQSSYTSTSASLQSLKDKSDADTASFAQTPVGSESCLTADRMRGIAQLAADAQAALTPSGSGLLPVDGDTGQRPK